MKKVLIISQFLLVILFSPFNYAATGLGKVEEIKSCGSGDPDPGWMNYIFFKLSDDKWFGIFANHTSAGYDSNFNHSILLTAFSMNLDVEVNATYNTRTSCGVTANMLWNKSTDYLKITQPN